MPTVTLDLFSGRPNPSWTLTAAESAELDRRLAALPASPSRPPEAGLGYRGVLLDQPALRIHAGLVWLDLSPAGPARADPARSLERWLLGTARPHLDPALLSFALSTFPD